MVGIRLGKEESRTARSCLCALLPLLLQGCVRQWWLWLGRARQKGGALGSLSPCKEPWRPVLGLVHHWVVQCRQQALGFLSQPVGLVWFGLVGEA